MLERYLIRAAENCASTVAFANIILLGDPLLVMKLSGVLVDNFKCANLADKSPAGLLMDSSRSSDADAG